MKEVRRSDRVAEAVRMELSDILIRGKVRSSFVSDVVISGVRVTDDLSIARVYVRTLGGADLELQKRILEALGKAAGFMRRELGGKLRLRRVPELEFFWDLIIDQAQAVERALYEIEQERKAAEDKGDE